MPRSQRGSEAKSGTQRLFASRARRDAKCRSSVVAGGNREGRPAGQAFVEHQRQGVEIALHEGVTPQLLRCHVRRSPGDHPLPHRLPRRHGEPEIGDLRLASGVEQHVAGLEIAVQHALAVDRRQTLAKLQGQLPHFLLHQRVGASAEVDEDRSERLRS